MLILNDQVGFCGSVIEEVDDLYCGVICTHVLLYHKNVVVNGKGIV